MDRLMEFDLEKIKIKREGKNNVWVADIIKDQTLKMAVTKQNDGFV